MTLYLSNSLSSSKLKSSNEILPLAKCNSCSTKYPQVLLCKIEIAFSLVTICECLTLSGFNLLASLNVLQF